ncbi:hypothetical protein [Phenylobacterium montanum]|uniref:Uncharacterized protein n=1 Tax=Phenylobacterium montanum TaxID=2823693 RepID=A0A975ITQ4_9CAUL|nr:hypothetical protein [Caulobacter sp. S6]QUD86970.1 hypothetical protein KCG34_18105 [Caulobacter sp. S6]
MYQALDPYLNTSTWHTNHANDDARFYQCLRTIVCDPNFNPDTMGDYMYQQKGFTKGVHTNPLTRAIDHRVTEAWAIRDFVRQHHLCDCLNDPDHEAAHAE